MAAKWDKEYPHQGKLPKHVKKKKSEKKAGFLDYLEKAAKGGPFDASTAAAVAGDDEAIAGLARNRHEHPLHYWLNPFVGGPLMEIATRMNRRVNAGMHGNPAGTLGGVMSAGLIPLITGGADDQAKARQFYKEKVKGEEDREIAADAAKADARPAKHADYSAEKIGPYTGQRAANVSQLDKVIAGATHNRHKHFLHYLLNPFVAGPMTEGLGRVVRRIEAAKGRSMPDALFAEVGAGGLGGITGGITDVVSGSPQLGDAVGRTVALGATGAQAGLRGGADAKTDARRAHERANADYRPKEEKDKTKQAAACSSEHSVDTVQPYPHGRVSEAIDTHPGNSRPYGKPGFRDYLTGRYGRQKQSSSIKRADDVARPGVPGWDSLFTAFPRQVLNNISTDPRAPGPRGAASAYLQNTDWTQPYLGKPGMSPAEVRWNHPSIQQYVPAGMSFKDWQKANGGTTLDRLWQLSAPARALPSHPAATAPAALKKQSSIGVQSPQLAGILQYLKSVSAPQAGQPAAAAAQPGQAGNMGALKRPVLSGALGGGPGVAHGMEGGLPTTARG